MTGCDWCHTTVPAEGWPKDTRLPDGRTVALCSHCSAAATVGDYSLDRYLGPADPSVDDSTAD